MLHLWAAISPVPFGAIAITVVQLPRLTAFYFCGKILPLCLHLSLRPAAPMKPPTSQRNLSSLDSFSSYPGWQHIFGETRTRILLWYLLILGLLGLIGIPAFQYLLFQQVDERVLRNVAEEANTFRQIINQNQGYLQNSEDGAPEDLEHFHKAFQANNSNIIPPESREELIEFFEQYLRYRTPEDDTFLITFVDGQFLNSTPSARPQLLSRDSDLMQQWKKQSQPAQGEARVKSPDIGTILYQIEPVQIQGETRGIFVVAHTTAGERAEILDALRVMMQGAVVLFAISLVLVWFTAGQVLAPLRAMTATAQIISETDLSQRLPVQGHGELANMAATFNSMMDRLEVAFDTQREFINDAGHELRTPITVIQGNLELMGDDPEEQKETFTIVMSELARMGRMADNMISLAKAERSDFLHLGMVNAAELTEELFSKMQSLAERNWQLDEIAQGQIVVDRVQITEAVMNLAQNATQYTRREDIIALGSTIARGKVHFWVRDTGDGIPLPDHKRIFERFARATNSRSRREGCGLGLSIVKAIAEAHGGNVFLRSQLGSGSMFTLVLPLDPPQEVVGHAAYPYR